ncbi:hypothetical protein T11_12784 [Trichinella zimbabwensis]|uniref:Uncharacterized protein n=1 Tax=Trichinella zimbabwensis TaxID=268475 RepID=A0A0V1H9C1_9BILA|nr:hypothetical protein T11_12784 [Trichinella zimbabwensis]
MNEKNHCALIAPSFKNDENTIMAKYFHDDCRICILSRGHLLPMDCYISILLENCQKTSQKFMSLKLIKVKKDFLQPTITTTFQLDNAYHHNSTLHNAKLSFFFFYTENSENFHSMRRDFNVQLDYIQFFFFLSSLFEKKNVIPSRFSDEFYCLFCILQCCKGCLDLFAILYCNALIIKQVKLLVHKPFSQCIVGNIQ